MPWMESALEAWVREFLTALRRHGVSRYDDLPAVEQPRLDALAAEVWPALRKARATANELVIEGRLTTPEEVDAAAPQILPELDFTRDEAVQLANYRVAQRMLQALAEMATNPTAPHPIGERLGGF
jgi:hypothetical protein